MTNNVNALPLAQQQIPDQIDIRSNNNLNSLPNNNILENIFNDGFAFLILIMDLWSSISL